MTVGPGELIICTIFFQIESLVSVFEEMADDEKMVAFKFWVTVTDQLQSIIKIAEVKKLDQATWEIFPEPSNIKVIDTPRPRPNRWSLFSHRVTSVTRPYVTQTKNAL